jgi:predicted GH43/DUF377 family glycosyl hydrolase
LEWESRGVTNGGVARLPGGEILLVYRSYCERNIGYLFSCRLDADGAKVIDGARGRSPFNRVDPRELSDCPDGCGDVRINPVNGWYYAWTYGRNNRQLALNRQKFGNDLAYQFIGGRQIVAFRTKNTKDWEYLGILGPDEFDKNAFLHPEIIEIGGMPYYALFHRIQTNIQVALMPSLEDFARPELWRPHLSNLPDHTLLKPLFSWEGVAPEQDWPGSVAGGAPPLRVPPERLPGYLDPRRQYWLMFYNASGRPREGKIARDRRIGAVLLALKPKPEVGIQPFDVVARAPTPLIVPDIPLEFDGPNGDVVFVTGALMTTDGEHVDIFFGSGDVAISKARFNLGELIDYLARFDQYGRVIEFARPARRPYRG